MKRLKMAIAVLLAFALLPLIGSTALADESSASSSRGTDSRGSKH